MASQSVSTRMAPNYLFNQSREMFVVCSGDTRGTPSKREMKLKIFERSLDNNEREIRAELSCTTDDDFVYAGGVTKATFPRLVEKFCVIVDFENFARKIAAQLSASGSQPIDIYVVLSDDRSKCTLQFSRTSDIGRQNLPLELKALKGEELLSYLKGTIRAQREMIMEHSKARKEAKDKIVELEKEVEMKRKLEEENKRLGEILQEAREIGEEHKLDRISWEQKCERAEGRLEDMEEKNEKLKEEIEYLHLDVKEAFDAEDEAKKEIEELNGRIEEQRSLIEDMESDFLDITDKLRDAEEKISSLRGKTKNEVDAAISEKMMKYMRSDETSTRSCDEKKLKELEGDLNEKNEMIDQMSKKMEDLRKEKEQEREQFNSERIRLEESIGKEQREVERLQRLVEVYRRPSNPHAPTFTSPNYSPSPLAYSTPPCTLNTTTPSTRQCPPLGALSRPLTPLNGRPLDRLNGSTANFQSPRVLSYTRTIANSDK